VEANIDDHREHRFTLTDGRTLLVAEWGDPAGLAVIAHHGTPGGRLSVWHDPAIYARLGLRWITFDRPGYGASTRRPGRIVRDAADDVVAIADRLGLERFAIAGRSGGGPHALACAALLPDRVIRCVATVSPAPFDAAGLDWTAGQTAGNVEEAQRSIAGEASLRAKIEPDRLVILERLRGGRPDFLTDDYAMAESDLAEMETSQAQTARALSDALRDGVDGWVDDDLAFVHPWGFDVSSIAVPTLLSYGVADTLVPAAHGAWLAAHVPNATVEVSDGGHLADEAEFENQLRWLRG
jgi:pimeloyl-ACP methyl ester carboxylesterase